MPDEFQEGSTAEAAILAPVLESGVVDTRNELGQRLFVPQINWSCLSVAAFASSGSLLAASRDFPATDAGEVEAAWRHRTQEVAPMPARLDDGAPSIVALVSPEVARRWGLDPGAQAIVRLPDAYIVGVWMAASRTPSGLSWACERLGLTSLQAKVVTALACHGNLRAAAARAGVTYATAREALGGAMARTDTRKRSVLIDRVSCLAFGVLPEGGTGANLLEDIWGLTPRQARLSMALAQGASRDAAARGAGVSEAVAKKELTFVFETLGVTSGAGLTAYLSEATSIAALSRLVADDIHFAFDRSEPLRLVPARQDGRMIAVSDYGPRSGRPVLVLHSSSASRPVPSVLLSALHARGFRPISIDRPGFGLTDPMPLEGDPFALAGDDIRTVCDALGFDKIDVVARGGAQVAVHFAVQSPERVARVVLVAPDPPTRISRPTSGVLGAIKRALQTNPHVMEVLSLVLVSSLRRIDAKELMRKAVATSVPDLQTMEDARNFADYRRGFQMFLSGRLKGYVREQAALVTEPDPAIPANTIDWHVLIGLHDPLHEPAEMESYWRILLPDARFTVLPDAGRFIVMSHPELVVAALQGRAG
ncbi:alpha/beta fold hydrolase [Hyphomonas sp.]|uniref:alpha/beta fold hydrolase n=1 Tax=Hyphomonas sp. TaxID=87 RepID=UPI0025C496D6|nr:alpha/beta fold hydrolase [Hyphomonas sp.]MBI1399428.1 alpha/beta fold hydrolase [Hyphomonas sp.]